MEAAERVQPTPNQLNRARAVSQTASTRKALRRRRPAAAAAPPPRILTGADQHIPTSLFTK